MSVAKECGESPRAQCHRERKLVAGMYADGRDPRLLSRSFSPPASSRKSARLRVAIPAATGVPQQPQDLRGRQSGDSTVKPEFTLF